MQAAQHLLQGLAKDAAAAAAPPAVATQGRRKQRALHGRRKLCLCCWAAPGTLLAWAAAPDTRQAAPCRCCGSRCAAATAPAAPAAQPAAPEAGAAAALLLQRLCRRLCCLKLPEAALQVALSFYCRCCAPILLLLGVGWDQRGSAKVDRLAGGAAASAAGAAGRASHSKWGC